MPLLRVVNESFFPFLFEVMSRPMRVMRLMMTHPKALVARRKSAWERPGQIKVKSQNRAQPVMEETVSVNLGTAK